MDKDCYKFVVGQDDFTYIFISEGVKGKIAKGVLISPLPAASVYPFSSVYNLGFGDFVNFDRKWIIDDSVRSGNGDMPKVIATVARIAMDFLTKNPDSVLSFEGYMDEKSALHGRNHRNVLYQRAINSNWAELSEEFRFWGVQEGKFEEYSVGTHYDQILVGRL
ncbi:hypothetical protein SAMN05216327_106212 [Dyadobacter sp. SG02]|uniref:DUF6934 family protein n=1 Tax=Dyadobacter sp. SG02 TaxID=1855291 RepID=UPI0008C7C9D3|nr:hypothetical protein [Dyadobacter sp. SG02]SEJ12591.1 hypothetical protein SAMN05216327_106212 [Dyadobacter sp. SG02]